MIKVSVIVPVYNVEKYLGKCLDSLVKQTLQEIEILIVNDGSRDGSQAIINEFQEKHPQLIKSFSKVNGGLSDARNFGIDRAGGEYIAFVDSDDYVTPQMMADLYRLATEHEAEMVICNIQKVDEEGRVTQKLPQIPNLPEKVVLKDHFSVFSDISYFACNKLFHRSLFKEKRFTKGMHFEDIQLIPQLLLECDTIAHTNAYHYQYLERADSISKTHNERGLDILRAVQDVEDFFGRSKYRTYTTELKGFQILEGVYTYLAYLAFVKNTEVYNYMREELEQYRIKNKISLWDSMRYRRFGKNYLLSLPLRKKIYYLLYFFGGQYFLRKMI